jgi:hypothetical protein
MILRRTPDVDFTWLAPDLAVGAALAPGAATILSHWHGVGCVIDMRDEACDDEAELAAAGISFLRLPTPDHHAPSQAQLDGGVAFADAARQAGSRLLVHCQHGIGRSATLALCVLVHRGVDPLEALSTAKDRRELISPSPVQYEAWAAWVRRRVPAAMVPTFAAFKAVAYRHPAFGA